MLPPSATLCCHLVCKVSSTPKACGAAVAVRSGRCRVRAQESKVRFADHPGVIAEYCRVSRYRSTLKWMLQSHQRAVLGVMLFSQTQKSLIVFALKLQSASERWIYLVETSAYPTSYVSLKLSCVTSAAKTLFCSTPDRL
jgi:hypothetical protein